MDKVIYLGILRFYLQIGDEIIEVNGKLFQHLTHDEAVNVLKSNTRLTFMVTYIGKVPHSSLVPNRLVNPNVASASGKQLEKSTVVVSSHQQPPMQSWSKPVHHVSDVCDFGTYLCEVSSIKYHPLNEVNFNLL